MLSPKELLLTVLVESNLWTSLSITSMGMFVQKIVCNEVKVVSLSLLFWSTLFIYTNDHYSDRKKSNKKGNIPDIWCQFQMLVSFLLTVYWLTQCNHKTLVIFFSYFTVGFLWNVPVVVWKTKEKKYRIKDIPYLKALLLSGTVSIATVAIPLSECNLSPSQLPIWVLLLIEGIFFVNAVMFDVRDEAEDKVNGTPTFPVIWGIQNTKYLLYFVLFVIQMQMYFTANNAPLITINVLANLIFVFSFSEKTSKEAYVLCGEGTLFLPLSMGILQKML